MGREPHYRLQIFLIARSDTISYMSRSHKDGRHRGGHVDHQNTEVWSKRCENVNFARKCSNGHAPRGGPGYKTITHRFERRQGRAEIEAQLLDEELANDVDFIGEPVIPIVPEPDELEYDNFVSYQLGDFDRPVYDAYEDDYYYPGPRRHGFTCPHCGGVIAPARGAA